MRTGTLLSKELFVRLVGERFMVSTLHNAIADTLMLAVVEDARSGVPDRVAYLLVFHGSVSTELPAAIMTVSHPAFGEASIHLAPFARDASATYYQAVFN